MFNRKLKEELRQKTLRIEHLEKELAYLDKDYRNKTKDCEYLREALKAVEPTQTNGYVRVDQKKYKENEDGLAFEITYCPPTISLAFFVLRYNHQKYTEECSKAVDKIEDMFLVKFKIAKEEIMRKLHSSLLRSNP